MLFHNGEMVFIPVVFFYSIPIFLATEPLLVYKTINDLNNSYTDTSLYDVIILVTLLTHSVNILS